MDIKKEIAQELVSADLGTLYDNFVVMLEEDEDADQSIYDDVRYGIWMMFDIHDEIDGYIQKRPKQQIVIIANKAYRLSDYRTEIEKRKTLMRKALYDHAGISTTLMPRRREEK